MHYLNLQVSLLAVGHVIIPVLQMRKLKECHERGTLAWAVCSDFQRVEDGQRGGGEPGDPRPY